MFGGVLPLFQSTHGVQNEGRRSVSAPSLMERHGECTSSMQALTRCPLKQGILRHVGTDMQGPVDKEGPRQHAHGLHVSFSLFLALDRLVFSSGCSPSGLRRCGSLSWA